MKFILVPLLIIGMFISFAAALVAMLFFTQTVRTGQEVLDLVLGNKDSINVFEEFSQPEDRLAELAKLTEDYKERYDAMTALMREVGVLFAHDTTSSLGLTKEPALLFNMLWDFLNALSFARKMERHKVDLCHRATGGGVTRP